MIRQFIILPIVMLLLCIPVASQSIDDWQVIIHDNNDSQVYRITPDGLSAVDLPTSIQPVGRYQEQNYIHQTVVSSFDGRFLAYMDTDFSIHIADLVTGECCQTIANPYVSTIDPLNGIALSAINPEGTAIMLSVIMYRDTDPRVIVEVMIVDIDGNTTYIDNHLQGCMPLVGTWQPDGIEIIEPCDRGDAPLFEHFGLLNPTGWSSTSLDGIVSFGELLPLTGEYMKLKPNYDYPYGGERGLHSPLNSLVYGDSLANRGELIFLTLTDEPLQTANWVADGRVILLQDDGTTQADLIYRDGQNNTIQYANATRFITGTPDGWLAVDSTTGELLHFSVGDNHDTQMTVLGAFANSTPNIHLIYRTMLGASMTQSGFTTVPQLSVTVTPSFCPNTVMPALTIGRSAYVIPGSANNVRSDPSSTAELVGQIPSGEDFDVLDGPRCANDMAWWKIDYNGLIGWTSEGQGDEYWLSSDRG